MPIPCVWVNASMPIPGILPGRSAPKPIPGTPGAPIPAAPPIVGIGAKNDAVGCPLNAASTALAASNHDGSGGGNLCIQPGGVLN